MNLDPLKNLSKNQRYAAIGVALVTGGYVVVHHHSGTGSWNPFSGSKGTSSANNLTATDPVTGMAYSQDNVTDPLTGQTYLAEAQQYGSVAAAESAVSAFGLSSATGTGTAGGVNPQPGGSGGTGASVYTSDAAWAQAATAGLADVGFPETEVATALGDYLQSVPVTQTQAQYINTALAEYGNPPVGSFQIILKPSKQPGPGTSTVPYVIGQELVDAQRNIADAGLKSTASGPPFTPGHGTRIVTGQVPEAQAKLTPNSNVALTYKVSKSAVKFGNPAEHGPVPL